MGAIIKWVPTALKTANYVAAVGEAVRCDPTGGTFDVTAPVVTSDHAGRQFWIHNQSDDTTAIVVKPDSGHTINGGATFNMTTARQSIVLQYDGDGDWMVL